MGKRTLESVCLVAAVVAIVAIVASYAHNETSAQVRSQVQGVDAALYTWDGSTFQPVEWNDEATVLSLAARTSTTNSADLTNLFARGVRLHLDIDAASGTTPTLDIKVQAKDSLSGNYFDIPGAAFTQKTAAGTDDLTVYPGVAETANETVSDVIPRTWRVVATIGGTTPSFTFSVGASYVR